MNASSPGFGENISPGGGCEVDPGAVFGCRTGRLIADLALRMGPRVRIRSAAVIYAASTIGSGLETGHNVVIREESTMGDDLSIWSNSTIDYGCIVGDDLKIHCNVDVAQVNILEDEVFLVPGVQIANDPHPLWGPCMRGSIVKRGARIGVSITILPHVSIGAGALIGDGGVVTRDIPASTLAYGNPARPVRAIEEPPCPFDLVDRPYVGGLDMRDQRAVARSEP